MRNITLMKIEEIAANFYSAFAKGDAETMTSFYADTIEFEDPGFGKLKGDQAKMMWHMLIERSGGNLKIDFKVMESTADSAVVKWEARYPFSKTGRQIHNKITAYLTIKDGKITHHKDHFNLWKWSQQALGIKGLLLGWTPFFRKKIQQQTHELLKKYSS
jgi:ketosteroid isomerase-like protein